MEKPVRPASESYPSVCCSLSESVSYSNEAAFVDDVEDDEAPIFSISKSTMDVMAVGPSNKKDPSWSRLDLRRSSSTNTHCEQIAGVRQQLLPQMVQQANTQRLSLTTQNMDLQSPPALSERWISNMHRWSGCSGSTHSRSSTPDTVVWKGSSSRPCSLTQDGLCPSTPDSPLSKQASPPNTPSPLISPLHTPSYNLSTPSSSSTLTPSTFQLEDLPESPQPSSQLQSQQQTYTSSPLRSASPRLLTLTNAENDSFLENNLLSFRFPSPIPSSERLADVGESSDQGCLGDDVTEESPQPTGMQLLVDEESTSQVKMFTYMTPNSPGERRESRRGPLICNLELPWQPEQSCLAGRGQRSQLVSSLSDSRLGHCCRCNSSTRDDVGKIDALKKEVAVTSQHETADVAVQTISPVGSWWELKRNTSTSIMGSHSMLGSPPGSRLNLKSSVGSNSNLVSPSSSMFPVSSGEEEAEEGRGGNPAWDEASPPAHDPERRRSCLKTQAEEKAEFGARRSSMKQVQWDEDGMTWDVHGASVDPEVLTTAIRKHLELQNSPRPLRRSSKKKRAPKPPIISSVVSAMVPDMNPPVRITSSGGGNDGEGKEGDKSKDPPPVPRRRSRAEAEFVKDEDDPEVYGEGGMVVACKSPSRESGHKKSVIRSLRRPGWCGGSAKTND